MEPGNVHTASDGSQTFDQFNHSRFACLIGRFNLSRLILGFGAALLKMASSALGLVSFKPYP